MTDTDKTLPQIPAYVSELTDLLESAGFSAYAVGGCVRDSLMGREPNDWDLCTSATVDEMRRVFEGYRVVDVGSVHGTLVVVNRGRNVETTTFRVDGEYSDHRHPDRAVFTDNLELDLSRRDFTMNAMAYSPNRGLVDLFDGRGDIRRRVVRAVGDPVRRFDEDALRIMRALRFASTLDFGIDPATARAAVNGRELLRHVSAERIQSEFRKLVCGSGAARILREFVSVIEVFIPEFAAGVGFDQQNYHHDLDVWEHILRTLDNADPRDEVLRLAALFHDIGKPATARTGGDAQLHFPGHPEKSMEMADGIMTRLRFDGRTKKQVCALIEDHDWYLKPDEKQIRQVLARHGPEQARRLAALQRADMMAHAPIVIERSAEELSMATAMIESFIRTGAPLGPKDLEISGRDIMSLTGLPPGPGIGRLLEVLFREVESGRIRNTRDALEARLEELI